jgi:hypothetical protein
MTVVDPAALPGPLLAALGIIGTELHEAFDRQPWLREPGYSKQSCLLASLTVADFLRELGYADANVRSVAAVMKGELEGRMVHSLGIGVVPDGKQAPPGRFDGHIVTVVPSARLLIDTTLHQAIRPQWRGLLTGMMAVQYGVPRSGARMFGLAPFAGAKIDDGAGFVMEVVWLDRRDNKGWRKGGDNEEWRRVAVLAALRDRLEQATEISI